MQKVKYDGVLDGDTIKVIINGELSDVKLYLVDAPELRGDFPFSHESKKYLRNLLSNSEYVYLELGDLERDKYNKIHAYVWYYNDQNKLELINKDVVYNGFGRVCLNGSDNKYLNELKDAQEHAKNEKKNIWSIEGYVNDNGYVKGMEVN